LLGRPLCPTEHLPSELPAIGHDEQDEEEPHPGGHDHDVGQQVHAG
jgi:hypothetical protein